MRTLEETARMKKCVSKEFLDYCDKKYPNMNERPDLRRMFMYLCFGTYVADKNKDNRLKLDYFKLASIADRKHQAESRNFNALKFLNEFKALVLPQFDWTNWVAPDFSSGDWDGYGGKCRVVSRTGLDAQDWEMVQKELEFTGDTYYFDSGRKRHVGTVTAERHTQIKDYLDEYKTFPLNDSQKKIIDSLYSVTKNSVAITQKVIENEKDILDAIANMQPKRTDKVTIEEKRSRQLKILAAIKENSRVFYRPTPLGRTPRLHATGESVLALTSTARKAACKGWIDADLVSSQFIIISNLINAPIAKAFIKSKGHLWTYLNESMGNEGPPTKQAKDAMKVLIYRICFGSTRENVINELNSEYGSAELVNNPMIDELFKRRDAWLNKIKQNGQITDIWGNVHKLEKAGRKKDIYGNYIYAKRRWAGALAATAIQSIELEIISAVFDCARDHGKNLHFKIMLFQHDGFTLSCYGRDDEPLVLKRLNEYVQAKANLVGAKLGIDLSDMRLGFNKL